MVEDCNQILLCLEDSNCEGKMEYGEPCQKVNISDWDKNLLCDIWLKNVAVFCSYPDNLPETDLNCNRLNQSMKLVEMKSRLHWKP